MSSSFSTVYNLDGVFVFYKSIRSCIRGNGQSCFSLSIPLSLINMVSLMQHRTLNSSSTKTGIISKSLVNSAFINESAIFELWKTFQCYLWKTFQCLFECLDLNCISMFRDFDTILPIFFTHVSVYNLAAKWQLKLTCLVLLVKLLLEKEIHNKV